MSSLKVQSASKSANRHLMLLTAALLLCQYVSGSYIKVRPNTHREFYHLGCKGEYDIETLAELNKLCKECYNLFSRDPDVEIECKSSCFRNSLFPACVASLYLKHRKDEYENKIIYLNGQES